MLAVDKLEGTGFLIKYPVIIESLSLFFSIAILYSSIYVLLLKGSLFYLVDLLIVIVPFCCISLHLIMQTRYERYKLSIFTGCPRAHEI